VFYSISINRNCNFACLYCYQKDKKNVIISDEIIELIPEFILNYNRNSGDDIVSINISGGECLLYFEKVKKLINLIRYQVMNNKLPEPIIEVSTNISLLTVDIYKFFVKTHCKLFIGFDGIAMAQNANRKFTSGENTFDKCLKKLTFLNKEKLYAKNITINSVISNNNIQYLDDNFDWLNKKFPDFNISFNIAYNANWTNLSLNFLEKQLYNLANRYHEILLVNPSYSLNLFDRQIGMILSENNKFDYLCGAAKSSLGINCEGHIVACSTCTGMACEEQFIIGDIKKGINNSKKTLFFKNITQFNYDESCKNCAYKKRCYKYCPTSNFLSSGNISKVSETMCKINKILIQVSEYLLMKLNEENKNIVQKKFFEF
jgi:uncharacterized protein